MQQILPQLLFKEYNSCVRIFICILLGHHENSIHTYVCIYIHRYVHMNININIHNGNHDTLNIPDLSEKLTYTYVATASVASFADSVQPCRIQQNLYFTAHFTKVSKKYHICMPLMFRAKLWLKQHGMAT